MPNMSDLLRALRWLPKEPVRPGAPALFRPETPFNERAFQQWYREAAAKLGLSSNPDSDDQFYDYRAAFSAGAEPDITGHWPSQFKRPGHPAMVVGGFHVQTGERVKGTPRSGYADLVRLGWEPDTARRLSQMPEP
jgi:hypothetical protein